MPFSRDRFGTSYWRGSGAQPPQKQRSAEEAAAAEERARRHRLLWALRKQVEARDGTACHYCGGETFVLPVGVPFDTDQLKAERTLDHRVPVSRGGTDTLDNLVIACRTCNNRKGTRSYDVFKRHG